MLVFESPVTVTVSWTAAIFVSIISVIWSTDLQFMNPERNLYPQAILLWSILSTPGGALAFVPIYVGFDGVYVQEQWSF